MKKGRERRKVGGKIDSRMEGEREGMQEKREGDLNLGWATLISLPLTLASLATKCREAP